MIIITIGNSAAAIVSPHDPSPYKTDYWGICTTWGLAVTTEISVTGAVSGTCANPVVTLALSIYRDFPSHKVVPFRAAQVVGAVIGAALVYFMSGPVNDSFNLAHGTARDFGLRLFCYFAGWGSAVFPTPMNYWWVPISGPLCGGVVGAALYQWLTKPNLPVRAA